MTILVQAKDEEIMEWDQKYSNLYAAYEQLYHNYQITKTEYEVTLANIKSYEAKYPLYNVGYSKLMGIMRCWHRLFVLKIRKSMS